MRNIYFKDEKKKLKDYQQNITCLKIPKKSTAQCYTKKKNGKILAAYTVYTVCACILFFFFFWYFSLFSMKIFRYSRRKIKRFTQAIFHAYKFLSPCPLPDSTCVLNNRRQAFDTYPYKVTTKRVVMVFLLISFQCHKITWPVYDSSSFILLFT